MNSIELSDVDVFILLIHDCHAYICHMVDYYEILTDCTYPHFFNRTYLS